MMVDSTCDCRLYVGDLSSVCSEADLFNEFSKFGKVEEVNILRKGKASMGYGFVRMATNEEAIRAAAALEGVLVCGRRLKVRDAKFGARDVYQVEKYPLHFKFSALDKEVTTDEVKLRELFSRYGEVRDVSIRKKFFDRDSGLQKGYGFLKYSSDAVVEKVLSESNFIQDNIEYWVESSDRKTKTLGDDTKLDVESKANVEIKSGDGVSLDKKFDAYLKSKNTPSSSANTSSSSQLHHNVDLPADKPSFHTNKPSFANVVSYNSASQGKQQAELSGAVPVDRNYMEQSSYPMSIRKSSYDDQYSRDFAYHRPPPQVPARGGGKFESAGISTARFPNSQVYQEHTLPNKPFLAYDKSKFRFDAGGGISSSSNSASSGGISGSSRATSLENLRFKEEPTGYYKANIHPSYLNRHDLDLSGRQQGLGGVKQPINDLNREYHVSSARFPSEERFSHLRVVDRDIYVKPIVQPVYTGNSKYQYPSPFIVSNVSQEFSEFVYDCSDT